MIKNYFLILVGGLMISNKCLKLMVYEKSINNYDAMKLFKL